MSQPTRRSRDRGSQAGAAAVIMALFVAGLMIPLGAIGVDIARWYVEMERVQAAADAAATAGVTYMPEDIDKARARALEIAEDNGFPNSGGNTVTVQQGTRPTQLRVTISSSVTNQFGRIMGVDSSTLSRSAVADYNGPAPMGSPCNTFGNEPKGTALGGPVNSQLVVPPLANCSSNPDFWGSINGPDIHKTQGEQFASRTCVGGEDGCDSSKNNTEFDPLGYFYVIKVTQVGSPVTIQVYDPASVPTGQQCDYYPQWGRTATNNANDWTPADARARYSYPPYNDSSLCPGDNDMRASSKYGTEQPTVTSFGLRAPTDTLVPTRGTPLTSCAKQFKGYRSNQVTSSALTRGLSSYNPNLASVFHQWVTLCTFTPTVTGEYYLQVRSNVAFNGPSSATVTSGNPNIYSQMTDDTAVTGTAVNSFGIRAYSPGGGVAVSAWKSMRIFVNGASAETTFNLVRVVPAAQGKTLKFGFFDVGEGARAGASMTLVPPTDSNLTAAPLCAASGYKNETLSNCSLPISTSFNGRQQYIKAPIPNTYTCDWAEPGGCWWRVKVDFATSLGVHDATTWTAEIEGEPVRLIE